MINSADLYSRILERGPSPETILVVLSRIRDEGNLRKVIRECIRALQVYPHDVRIRAMLAETYLEAGLPGWAEREVEEVIRRMGDLVSVYKLQARILTAQGRDQEAARYLGIYLSHHPEDPDALALLEKATGSKQAPLPEPPPAATQAEGAAPAGTDDRPEIATVRLAEIYFDQGLVQEAIETYEKVVASRPGDEQSRKRLEELRGMVEEEKMLEHRAEEISDRKKRTERVISALEGWLSELQDKGIPGPSV